MVKENIYFCIPPPFNKMQSPDFCFIFIVDWKEWLCTVSTRAHWQMQNWGLDSSVYKLILRNIFDKVKVDIYIT